MSTVVIEPSDSGTVVVTSSLTGFVIEVGSTQPYVQEVLVPGAQGAKGDTGDTGPQGPQGEPGGLVAVKSALKTDTQVESSVAAGASFDVTGLSITHALSDANNKLIISAYFGIAQESTLIGRVGIAVADNGTLINIADDAGNRFRVTAGVRNAPGTNDSGATLSFTNVYSPGDTNSHTYTVRAISLRGLAMDIYINRTPLDTNTSLPRATSGLVIQEVSV